MRSLKIRILAAAARSLQSCPTLCDPIDGGSPLGCPVPGILQVRTLEWVAISFSNAWKWKVKVKSLSRFRLLATPWTAAYQAPPSMGFSRQEYWTGVPLPSLWMIPTCKQTSKFCWCNDEPKHSPCFHSTHILVEEKTQTHVHWVGDGQGGLACCDSWSCKELDMTERLNWTELSPRIFTKDVFFS